jgi:zinc protease
VSLFCNPAADPEGINRPEKISIGDRLSIIYQQDTASEITVVRVFINGGKKAELPGQGGLAFLTTRLCVEVPDRSKVKKMMDLGSSFSTSVEGDHSVITVECLSENLEDTLKILTEILRKPLFSALRISHIKKNMEYRRKLEEDNSWELMRREYFNLFFGNNGYGGSIFGDKDSLKKIKKKDVADYYKKFFNLSNMVISVSSDLDKTKIAGIIKTWFQSLPVGNELPRSTPDRGAEGTEKTINKEHSIKKDKTQSLVAMGALLPEISPRHFTSTYMLEVLLGEGIGSKLWPIREVDNLAYRLQAKAIQMHDAGILTVCLETDKTRKQKAFNALREIMTTLYERGITEEEFSAVKVRSWSYFLRNNETKEKRTYTLGYFESIGLGFGFSEEFRSQMEAVTLEEFNGYIKNVLKPERMATMVIGSE